MLSFTVYCIPSDWNLKSHLVGGGEKLEFVRQKGSFGPMDQSLLPAFDPCGLEATQQRDPVLAIFSEYHNKPNSERLQSNLFQSLLNFVIDNRRGTLPKISSNSSSQIIHHSVPSTFNLHV